MCVCGSELKMIVQKDDTGKVTEHHFLLCALRSHSLPLFLLHVPLRLIILSEFCSLCPCCVHLMSSVLLLMLAFQQEKASCDLFQSLCTAVLQQKFKLNTADLWMDY